MHDPDFEAGRSGALAPPNGDWTKFQAGAASRPVDGSQGRGCAILIAMLGGVVVVINLAPLAVPALAAALITGAVFKGQPLRRGWLKTGFLFLAAMVIGGSAASMSFLGVALSTQFAPDAPFGAGVSLTLSVMVGGAVYLWLMWLARPLKAPTPVPLQVRIWVVSSLLAATLGLVSVLGTLTVLTKAGVIQPEQAFIGSGGLLHPEANPFAAGPDVR